MGAFLVAALTALDILIAGALAAVAAAVVILFTEGGA